jgi:catechol 2,3-dioxygenase-like lactoylglutathione lyase family enzyme
MSDARIIHVGRAAATFGLRQHGRMIARDNGFHEAVGIVLDAAASAARLGAALGFVVRHQGPVPDGALALWGLSGGSGREIVLGHPDAVRGDIRLVQIDGPPRGLMRDGAQAWDPGGIFDINLRALAGIEPLHHALGRQGFRAHAPITDWDFGPLSVREVVENDADGLCCALMERVAPPLTGYEGLSGPASWVFNSTQIVSDFDAARAFYRDVMGWQVVQESQLLHENGLNCMGLPIGLAPQIPARVGVYQSNGRMEGSVEIIAFEHCGGIDFSAGAPPQRGWASLRFPVSDLDAWLARFALGDSTVIGPVKTEWAPHGPARAAGVLTAWGARLEAFELL